MATLLSGPNFSGRSKWLADRRGEKPWPLSGHLGAFPDLACTGLASVVREELAVASQGAVDRQTLDDTWRALELDALAGQQLHAVSGGESVRVGLASLAAQGVRELHVDGAFEQLDARWRAKILKALAGADGFFPNKVYVADNHIRAQDLSAFDEISEFVIASNQANPSLRPGAAFKELARTEGQSIAVNELSFSYGFRSAPIFRRASVRLTPGTVYFLTGENGSGKSTFVKLLAGALRLRSGEILYGKERFRPERSIARFAGVSLQNPDYQWTSLTVQAEVAQFGRQGDFERILSAFGIPPGLPQMSPSELPFVLKKRLGVALAALAGKPWLILDEPTLGQDLAYRGALAELLGLLASNGTGVIAISHDTGFREMLPEAVSLHFGNGTIRDGV